VDYCTFGKRFFVVTHGPAPCFGWVPVWP
jgi:hypothetical protein